MDEYSKMREQRGITLIVVLWMLVIMSLIAWALSQQVRTDLNLTVNSQHHSKARALAEEGIWRGAAMVLNRAIAEEKGEQVSLAGGHYNLASTKGELHVILQSCHGLIDINRAPYAIITQLLNSIEPPVENAQIISDSILDWRDEDDLKHAFGAERADYLDLGLDYGPNNGLFNSVSELFRVNGVTEEVAKKLIPLITVYSGQARIDINTAPAPVLAMLPGMDAAQADTLVKARTAGISHLDLTQLSAQTQKYIGASEHKFIRISSFSKVNDAVSGIMAVIRLEPTTTTPVTIMTWRQRIDAVFLD